MSTIFKTDDIDVIDYILHNKTSTIAGIALIVAGLVGEAGHFAIVRVLLGLAILTISPFIQNFGWWGYVIFIPIAVVIKSCVGIVLPEPPPIASNAQVASAAAPPRVKQRAPLSLNSGSCRHGRRFPSLAKDR